MSLRTKGLVSLITLFSILAFSSICNADCRLSVSSNIIYVDCMGGGDGSYLFSTVNDRQACQSIIVANDKEKAKEDKKKQKDKKNSADLVWHFLYSMEMICPSCTNILRDMITAKLCSGIAINDITVDDIKNMANTGEYNLLLGLRSTQNLNPLGYINEINRVFAQNGCGPYGNEILSVPSEPDTGSNQTGDNNWHGYSAH